MKSFTPGDVLEVETANSGRAYVQVTHNHPSYPEVIRALAGPIEVGAEAASIAGNGTLFVAMLPLSGAVENGFVKAKLLGNAAIPTEARDFPIFKMSIKDKHEGKRGDVAYWWFWDGDTLTYDADPKIDIDATPVREVMSVKDFLARLAS
jgi:hypothetical protein